MYAASPHWAPDSARTPNTNPKVYSYTRFSTPEQAKGDSYRRQTQAAERWATARGLALDSRLSILDEGVSAFRGSNAADGGLGTFLQLCQRGLIEPGSYLVVESLDRISRMEPLYAQQVFSNIVMSGVTIVTLSDNQEYSTETLRQNPMGLIMALMVSFRAYEESATKGRRVAAAWAEKRKQVANGNHKRLTCRGPSWLNPTGEGWEVNEARGAIVREIFRMTLAGSGEHAIAHHLNSEAVPTFGRSDRWHRSTVSKILRNPAVIGTLTPGRIEYHGSRRVRVLEKPVPHAYPAVVSEENWHAVRAIKGDDVSSARGRHGSAGAAHYLAGLARCPDCASAMIRVMKGSGRKAGKPKLVCSRAKVGAGCSYISVPCDELDSAVHSEWQSLLSDVPSGGQWSELDVQFSRLSASIEGIEGLLIDLATALENAPSAHGASRISRLEQEVRALRAERDELDERRALADQGLVRSRLGDLAELLDPESGETSPTPAVNAAMKTLFSAVVIDHRQGTLRFQWRQGAESVVVYAWRERGTDETKDMSD